MDLFFVLSGFLIASQLLKPVALNSKPPLKDFFIRRTLRIWPNFFIIVALYFLVPGFREKESLPALMEISNVYSEFRFIFKRTRDFFTRMVALHRRTILSYFALHRVVHG